MGRSTSLYTKAYVIPKPQQTFLDLLSCNLREMLFTLLSFPMDSYLCCKFFQLMYFMKAKYLIAFPRAF